MAANELSGISLQFNPVGLDGPELKGDLFLQAIGLQPRSASRNLGALAAFSTVFLLAGYAVVSWRVDRRRIRYR